MIKRFSIVAAIALMVLAAPSAVFADLALGDFHVNSDSGLAGTTFTNGSIPSNYSAFVTTMTNPFSGDFGGDVTSTVWRDPSTGELAFEYQFTIDTATSPLRSGTIGGDWATTTVYEVGADSSVFGSSSGNWTDGDPLTLGRLTSSGFGSPSMVWSTLLFPGEGIEFPAGSESSTFWYATNATTYTIVDLDALDGGLSAEAPVFAVPAPGAVLLGAMGLGLVGWVRRKMS